MDGSENQKHMEQKRGQSSITFYTATFSQSLFLFEKEKKRLFFMNLTSIFKKESFFFLLEQKKTPFYQFILRWWWYDFYSFQCLFFMNLTSIFNAILWTLMFYNCELTSLDFIWDEGLFFLFFSMSLLLNSNIDLHQGTFYAKCNSSMREIRFRFLLISFHFF